MPMLMLHSLFSTTNMSVFDYKVVKCSFHRLYAVCCVHPLPNIGLVFCDFISVTEFFTMFFYYFWGHDFFPASRDAVWSFKGERGTAIVLRFRRRDGIWSCVRCEWCFLVQKRNGRAGVKLLSFQFNCFHFRCSIPTCFFSIIYFLS